MAWRAASALANLAEWPELVPTLQEAGFDKCLIISCCCWEGIPGHIFVVGLKSGMLSGWKSFFLLLLVFSFLLSVRSCV